MYIHVWLCTCAVYTAVSPKVGPDSDHRRLIDRLLTATSEPSACSLAGNGYYNNTSVHREIGRDPFEVYPGPQHPVHVPRLNVNPLLSSSQHTRPAASRWPAPNRLQHSPPPPHTPWIDLDSSITPRRRGRMKSSVPTALHKTVPTPLFFGNMTLAAVEPSIIGPEGVVSCPTYGVLAAMWGARP
ncbi:unnamed protein product [Ectocarpus sp. 4 AP-2014]